MIVTIVREHPDGGHVVVTDTMVEFHDRETPFFMYVEEGAQLKIVDKGFVSPEDILPGDVIDDG